MRRPKIRGGKEIPKITKRHNSSRPAIQQDIGGSWGEKEAYDRYYMMGGEEVAKNQSVEWAWCCNFFIRICCTNPGPTPNKHPRPWD